MSLALIKHSSNNFHLALLASTARYASAKGNYLLCFVPTSTAGRRLLQGTGTMPLLSRQAVGVSKYSESTDVQPRFHRPVAMPEWGRPPRNSELLVGVLIFLLSVCIHIHDKFVHITLLN